MNNNPNERNTAHQDGTVGRTAPTLRDRRRKQKQNILYLAQLALLTAVIMVLHFSGVAIPAFGTKISLVLIPIALGAMLLGPAAGAILGFIYGMTVFVSLGVLHMDPFTGFLFDNTPVMAALICTVKTTAAGLVAGWVYRVLSKKNVWLAVFVAAALVPTVNTGVFVLGCFLIYSTISEFAAGAGYSAVYFILIVCAGINYVLELAINLIFSPALERLVRLLSKKLRR
ncbi:MAG: ECF transporter S component [Clostridia bacterium]|nr:ECF transporter S component [Clostridia bacterium]